jgi:hypothetical protein
MSGLKLERASLLGRIGAHSAHSRHDSRDLAANARAAFLETFLHQVDPNRELPEAERRRRAEHAKKAYFARLTLKSAQVRRAMAEATR